MAQVRVPQTNFVRGEIDPLLLARGDIRVWQQAAKRMRNVSLLPQGGFRRRPGSKRLYDIGTPNVALSEFVFSGGEKYVFVLSNGQVQIFDLDGNLIQTIAGPWTTGMLPRLYWGQSLGTLIITHPLMWPQRIKRTGPGTFALSNYPFEAASGGYPIYQPYYKFADDTITLTPSATTGSITLTTSAAYWQAGHVGMKVRYQGKTCTITAFTSSTVVTATVNETLAGTTASATWDEQYFSGVWGYPVAVGFHNQRTLFAGHLTVPDGFAGSKVGAPFNHDLGTGKDNEAIFVTIGSTDLNEIRAIMSGQHLQIFTDRGPFYVPGSDTKPITPLTITFLHQQPYGSAYVRPRVLDGATVFLQKDANVMREFMFDFVQVSYKADSVSLLSGHLLSAPVNMVVALAGTAQPNDYAFVLNADGTLAQFQSVRAEQLAGWTGWNTLGTYLAVSAVDQELLYVAKRTLGGVDKYFLEKFVWDEDWTLDCATKLTNGGVPTINWSGLAYLANQTVSVVGGGDYFGDYTVDGAGSLVINVAASEITVGLNYSPDVETLPVDGGLQDGPLTGEVRSIVEGKIRTTRTLSLKVGAEALITRKGGDDFSLPPTPVTGWSRFTMDGWSEDPTITLSQDAPLKMTVLGMTWRLAA